MFCFFSFVGTYIYLDYVLHIIYIIRYLLVAKNKFFVKNFICTYYKIFADYTFCKPYLHCQLNYVGK